MATPAGQAAAAERDDHAGQVGDVLDQLEPERALAGDDGRVVERVAERHAPSVGPVAGGGARPRRARRRPRPRWRRSARQASIFVIGAPAGTKMSHGTPKWRAANASAWAWLPALPAVTPLAAAAPERGQLVHRAADLERPGALQVLGLEHDVAAGRSRQRDRRDDRRVLGDGSTATRAARMSASVTVDARPCPPDVVPCRRPAGRARSAVPVPCAVRALVDRQRATTSTPGSSGTPARARLRLHRGHREHPDDWPTLDGVELVLSLGSEWNVYRPGDGRARRGRGGLRARRSSARRAAACHLLRRPGARARPRRRRSPRVADAGDRLVRPSARRRAAAVAAGPWMEWHYDVLHRPGGLRRAGRAPTAGPQLIARPAGRGHAVPSRGDVETMVAGWLRTRRRRAAAARHGGRPRPSCWPRRRRQRRQRAATAASALVDWFLDKVAELGLHSASTPSDSWRREALGGDSRTLVASWPDVVLPPGLPHRGLVRPRRAAARWPAARRRRGHPAEQAERRRS